MNYYEILQVSEKADQEVIEAAYKGLVKKYHPDKNPSTDTTQKMKEINNAYSVLKNPVSRGIYDQQLLRERKSQTPPPQSKPSDSKTAHHQSEGESISQSKTYREKSKPEVKPEPRKSSNPSTENVWESFYAPNYFFFRNILENMSNPRYFKLGLYCRLLENGALQIIDQGQQSLLNSIRFVFFLVFAIVSGFTSIYALFSDPNQKFIESQQEPYMLLVFPLFIIMGWSTFILRPRSYKLIFDNDRISITMHGIFKRSIKYNKILNSEIYYGDPSYLKIRLKNGKVIKTMRYAYIMDVAHQILEVMIKNKL